MINWRGTNVNSLRQRTINLTLNLGFLEMNNFSVPFSIHSDTKEGMLSVSVKPSSGNMLSCRSLAHARSSRRIAYAYYMSSVRRSSLSVP
jgi:hypothetical protein